MRRWRKQRRQAGFTVVELMMASAIFSVVALVALTGFIEIGRLFYKGATYTANQQVVRTVVDQVRADMASSSVVNGPLKVAANGGISRYYCIGNARYTFIPGNIVREDNHDLVTKFGLVRDKLAGAGACANPFDPPAAVAIDADAAELIGNKMRLNSFCLTPNASVDYGNLFDLSVSVVSGEDQYLTLSDDTSPSDCRAAKQASCNTKLSISQYCAVNDLDTSVAVASGGGN